MNTALGTYDTNKQTRNTHRTFDFDPFDQSQRALTNTNKLLALGDRVWKHKGQQNFRDEIAKSYYKFV